MLDIICGIFCIILYLTIILAILTAIIGDWKDDRENAIFVIKIASLIIYITIAVCLESGLMAGIGFLIWPFIIFGWRTIWGLDTTPWDTRT